MSYGEGTRKVSDDRGLIRYLMRHRHTTPFEMAELKFLVRVPMDCWRQWIRHRTANVNEYSTRYSLAIDAAQATARDQWRSQAAHEPPGKRQGCWTRPSATSLTAAEARVSGRAGELYEERLDAGVAREQARKDLPLSTYTEAYWKIDLHNLLHFLALRMDGHAQWEIRQYATTIGEEIVRPAVSAGVGGVRRLPAGGDVLDAARPRSDRPADAAAGGRRPGLRRRRRFSGRARCQLGATSPAAASETNAAKSSCNLACCQAT